MRYLYTRLFLLVLGMIYIILGANGATLSNANELVPIINITWESYGTIVFIVGVILFDAVIAWTLVEEVPKLVRKWIISIIREELKK